MTAYIHGTAPSEQDRLATLNRLTNAAFLDFLDVRPGMRVLDVGCGLGILASEVAARGASVVAIDRHEEQLAKAVRHRNVEYRQGDAHRIDFAEATFDLVYARYLLEHVADPTAVVGEMRRLTRDGGRIAVAENDISLIRFHPELPAFDRVWSAFAELQSRLGGDAWIGRRLFAIFRAAGLTRVELSVQPEVHWHGSPGFEAWIANMIGNVESGRAALVEAGLATEEGIDGAIAELRDLLSNDRASCNFVWNRAMGWKGTAPGGDRPTS